MKFLFTKAGIIEGAKFTKKIGNKNFSYTGSEEEGILFEEFVFQAVTECLPELKDETFVVVTEIKDELLAISFFNDKSSVYEGEETVFYDLSAVSKEDANGFLKEFLSELIAGENAKIYVESVKTHGIINVVVDEKAEKISIESSAGACEIDLDKVVPEELISGFKKFKRAAAKIVPPLMAILLMAIANFGYYKYYLHGEKLQAKIAEIKTTKTKIDEKRKKLDYLINEMTKYLSDAKAVKKAKDLKNLPPEAIIGKLEGIKYAKGKIARKIILQKAYLSLKRKYFGDTLKENDVEKSN